MVVRLRYLILLGWAVAAFAATLYLPALTSNGQDIGDLVAADAPAIRTEIASLQTFSVPCLSRIAVVQRDPRGLTPAAQARVFERALSIDTKSDPAARGIAGAIPITNTLGLFPGSRERSTTAITYLFFGRDVSIQDQVARAHAFERGEIRQPGDSLVGVTGPLPAQVEQSDLIVGWLPRVEVATILVIALIVGLYFRSFGPPLLTLAAAGVAYLVSVRVVA